MQTLDQFHGASFTVSGRKFHEHRNRLKDAETYHVGVLNPPMTQRFSQSMLLT